MAVPLQEVPIVEGGMAPDQHGHGPWIANMEPVADRLRVRPGWGQVSQFDTTLAFHVHTDPVFLGARLLVTDFGHEQIVCVHEATVFTGGQAAGALAQRIGIFAPTYLVSIYDVTTDRWWEEVVHPRSQEQVQRNDRRHAQYQTDRTADVSGFLAADDSPFFFHEFRDMLFMGSRRAGLWAYIPADFGALRTQQLTSVDHRDAHIDGYGESALLVRVATSPGGFSDAVAYLLSGEFPRPVDVSSIADRLVLADDRILWFSDPGRPGSIAAENFVQVPSERPITSVTEVQGNLLIHTATESWLYLMPSSGFLVSGGRLIKVSPEVGCSGPEMIVRGGGRTWWTDDRGAWSTADGVTIDPAAPGWESFWREHVSDPLSQWWQQSGGSAYTTQQPRLQHRHDPAGASATWDHVRDRLLLSFPAQGITLVLEDGGWLTWLNESAAQAASTVSVRANLPGLRPLAGERDLYAVSAFDTPALLDDTLVSGLGAPDSTVVSVPSLAILRLGRGGALDRSVESEREDVRRLAGRWHSFGTVMGTAPDGANAFRIGVPVKVPAGFAYPNAVAVAGTQDWLLPIEVVPDSDMTLGPRGILLDFNFDNTHWTPVLRPGSPEVDFLLPAERLESVAGYTPGAPVAGTSEIQVYNSATGLPSATGNQIRLAWSGIAAGYVGMYAPTMNLTPRTRNRLVWIPMRYSGLAGDDVLRMGLLGVLASLQNAAVPYVLNCDVVAWQEALHAAARHDADDVAQPVDWALKSGQLGLKGAQQVKARTVYLSVRGSGQATTQIVGTATHGLLNVLWGSDFKDWSAQVVDHAGNIERAASVGTLRSRLRNTTAQMVGLTFGSAATTWGDPAVATTGNVIVADRPVDTIAISDSVRGEHVSVMLFGHVRSRAERLDLGDAKVGLLAVGSRRRRGR